MKRQGSASAIYRAKSHRLVATFGIDGKQGERWQEKEGPQLAIGGKNDTAFRWTGAGEEETFLIFIKDAAAESREEAGLRSGADCWLKEC